MPADGAEFVVGAGPGGGVVGEVPAAVVPVESVVGIEGGHELILFFEVVPFFIFEVFLSGKAHGGGHDGAQPAKDTGKAGLSHLAPCFLRDGRGDGFAFAKVLGKFLFDRHAQVARAGDAAGDDGEVAKGFERHGGRVKIPYQRRRTRREQCRYQGREG